MSERCNAEVVEVRKCGERTPCPFHWRTTQSERNLWREMCSIDGDWGGTQWATIINRLLNEVDGPLVDDARWRL